MRCDCKRCRFSPTFSLSYSYETNDLILKGQNISNLTVVGSKRSMTEKELSLTRARYFAVDCCFNEKLFECRKQDVDQNMMIMINTSVFIFSYGSFFGFE